MARRVRLDDRALRRLQKRLEASGNAHVKVGVLGSKGGNAPHDSSGISLVELAAIHEFGSPAAGIPERSFIRRTFIEKRRELEEVITKLARGVVAGKLDMRRALDILGAWASAEVKKTVTAGAHIPPPLKPATIERKGSDRPLIDTGRLIGAVTWEVVG